MHSENIAETIIAAANKPEVVDINGVPTLIVPPGWDTRDRSDTLPRPRMIEASPQFLDTDSFVEYVNRFNPNCRIFCDMSSLSVTAILDEYQADNPSHQRHTATLAFQESVAWTHWKAFSLHPDNVAAHTFRIFLEDNLEHIIGEFSGARVLDMSREIDTRSSKSSRVSIDGVGGKRRISFSDDTSVTGMGISFPEVLKVSLSVFEQCKQYSFDVRLRITVTDEKPYFTIGMGDPAIILNKAFSDEVSDIEASVSGAPEIYFGSP